MADYHNNNEDPFVFGNFSVDDIFRQLNGQMANMQQPGNNGTAAARPNRAGGNNNKKKWFAGTIRHQYHGTST